QAVGLETPPRTWGRHHSVRSPQLKHGNTPTDVGKTIWHSTACIESRKHPHGRGEDPTIEARGYRRRETPPRTWGRPFSSLDGCILRRNTPTDVGKTQRRAHAATSVWKHPHGRGEDSSRAHSRCSTGETPPRTWGRPRLRRINRTAVGNTPTDVGKTRMPGAVRSRQRKHPHGRGEDVNALRGSTSTEETPPRTWGRLL